MKRKIVLVTGLLLVSAYFGAPSSHAQEREMLRVSTLFIGSSLVPFWIGQEQGIFAKHGIDVELIWMQSNLSTAALLAGEVDTAFGTPQSLFAVLTAKNPPPLTTIAAWGSASEHWLVVNPAIKTGKDLEGKTIGVSRPRSADHGYTTVILERMAVDPRKITFLSTGGQGQRVEAARPVACMVQRRLTGHAGGVIRQAPGDGSRISAHTPCRNALRSARRARPSSGGC